VARTNESIIRTTGRHPARHMDHSFSRVHYPVPNPPHKPPREHAQALPVGWIIKICGGHGPGETPGPIPNPEAKTWHGDGTAPGRVWESSTPPHPNLTGRGHHSVPPPFFAYPNTTANTTLARRTREANPIPGHTRPRHAGQQNRTYDTQQDCTRSLLNMPASSFLSGFQASTSILW
jgi:hypothetical protein